MNNPFPTHTHFRKERQKCTNIYKIHKKYYSVGLGDELWGKRVQDELLVLLQACSGQISVWVWVVMNIIDVAFGILNQRTCLFGGRIRLSRVVYALCIRACEVQFLRIDPKYYS